MNSKAHYSISRWIFVNLFFICIANTGVCAPRKCKAQLSGETVSQNETTQTSHPWNLKLTDEQWSSNQFVQHDQSYKAYQIVSVDQPDQLAGLKSTVFFSKLYNLLYQNLNVEVVSQYALAFSPDGQKVKLAVEDYSRSWDYSNKPSKAQELRLMNLTKIGLAIKFFLGDVDVSRPSVYSEDGRLRVQIYGSRINDPHFQKPFSANEFLTYLDRQNVGAEHYKAIHDFFSRLDEAGIKRLIHEFQLPQELWTSLLKRKQDLLKTLEVENEVYGGQPEKIMSEALKKDKAARITNRSTVLKFIRAQLRKRLDQDIKMNTSFKNFEEYKQYVLGIPQYRKFIEEFLNTTVLSIHRHRVRRSYILRSGFKNLFETGTSSISQEAEYANGRLQAEATALGLAVEDYQTQIPASFRAKSTFVFHSKHISGSESRYGSDNYFISLARLIEKEDGPLVTLTIGDSLDDSFRWYSKPVAAEDFAYLAAPFIFDAQQRFKSPTTSTINYRGVDRFGKFPAVTPNFLGGLDKMLKIYIRDEVDGFSETMGIPSIYTEAQIYGYFGIGDVQTIAVNKNDVLSESLLEAYRLMGIQVIRYKSSE